MNIDKLKDIGKLEIKMPKLKLKRKKTQGKDFNFFQPYLFRKKEQKNRNEIIIAIFVVFTLLISGTYIWNFIKIKNLKNDVYSMQKTINSGKTMEKVSLSKKLDKKYSILNKYYNEVEKVNSAIENDDTVSVVLMKEITSTIPQGVSFQNMTISGSSIQISGSSNSRVEIAEFQHNLKDLYNVSKVEVPAITKNEEDNTTSSGNSTTNNTTSNSNMTNSTDVNSNKTVTTGKPYTFTLNCTLKDVDTNENK